MTDDESGGSNPQPVQRGNAAEATRGSATISDKSNDEGKPSTTQQDRPAERSSISLQDSGEERQRDFAPPHAVAPFDKEQAHGHQQAWAAHLGTNIEQRNVLGMSLILIPPGEFMMGSTTEQIAAAKKLAERSEEKPDKWTLDRLDAEFPPHRVRITQPYLMGATEVTIGQFRRFVEATSYVTEAEQFGGGNSTSKQEQDPQKRAATWRGMGGPMNEDSGRADHLERRRGVLQLVERGGRENSLLSPRR